MKRSSRSERTGPGSRGGRWHEKDFRIEYHRRWRANHPEYRQAEALRRARAKIAASGGDPTLVTESRRLVRLPTLAIGCVSCGEPIPGLCVFCAELEVAMRPYKKWTPQEDAVVAAATGLKPAALAARLGRSVRAVAAHRMRQRQAREDAG